MRTFHRLTEFLIDWKYLFQRDGIRPTLPKIYRELSQLPYRHLSFQILTRSLVEPFPDYQPKLSIDIVRFQQSHLDLVKEIYRPSEAQLCVQRLERGQVGLIALHYDRPAGYAWGCTAGDLDLERVKLQLKPNQILCTDVYTVPELRRKGIQTALTLARFQAFRDLGFQQAVCYIENNNQPSLAVWKRKFNAEQTGSVDFQRIGPFYNVRITWYSLQLDSHSQL